MAVINIDDAYILNETGAQVDKVTGLYFKDESTSAAEKAFAQLNIGTAGSNRNLLDNPWFTAGNVVNQRGFSSSSAEGYTVDRWKLLRTNIITATLGNDGMTISKNTTGYAFFSQYIGRAIDLEATYTLSVMTSDGQVYSATRKFVNGTSSETYVSIGGMNVGFGLYGKGTTPHAALYFGTSQTGSLTIKAIKLELGSVSTLANDAPPDYGQELDKCLYYFERIKGVSGYHAYGVGIAETATQASIIVSMHSKRTTSFTMSASGAFALYNGGIKTATLSLGSGRSSNALVVTATGSGLTAGGCYQLVTNSSADAYIDISADL